MPLFREFLVTLHVVTSFCSFMKSNSMQLPANRIKAVLAEQQRSARWLSLNIGKNETTVSRWCSNKVQPSVAQLQKIALLLNVDVRELLCSTKKEQDV